MTHVPTQVTFRGLAHQDELEAEIRDRVQWLEQFYGRLVGCRVLVDVPHRHQRGGRLVHVSVELDVPGGEPLLAGQEHRHAEVAVHEAFDVARRRLQDFARERRGAVKIHEGYSGV